MKNILQTIQDFIYNDQVQDILSKINDNMMDFNILEITGMGSQEIKHSNILSWFLSDNEHNLKYTILENLLKKIIDENLTMKNKDILQEYIYLSKTKKNITIYREKNNIDLLLVDSANKIIITIENKVYADERVEGSDGGQLKKYEDIINNLYDNSWDKFFIFLTINLDTPSRDNWLKANYQMIVDALENILKTKELSIKTKIIFESYIDMLKRSGIVENEKLKELCKKIWQENKEALEIIYQNQPTINNDILIKLRDIYRDNIYDFNKAKTDFAVFPTNYKKAYSNWNDFEKNPPSLYFGFYIVKSNIMFWVRLNNDDKKAKKYFENIKNKLDKKRSKSRIDIYAEDLIENFDINDESYIDIIVDEFTNIIKQVDECFK